MSERRTFFLKTLVLIIAVFSVYYPSVNAGFIWDDDTFFTHNPIMDSPNALWKFWFTTEPPDYFPLVSTVLWLERQLWDLNPAGYHLTNIGFHAINAFLLWRIFLRCALPGAWLAAMVFSLHPVQVESVSWATQIKTLQSTFFYLMAFLWYLSSHIEKKTIGYGISLFLFLLGLLSKTSVVMLPVVLLFYHIWKDDLPSALIIRRTTPFFMLSLVFGLVTIWFQYNSAGAKGEDWSLGFAERLVNAGYNIIFYLYKFVVPWNLTFIYPRWSFDPVDWFSWIPHLSLAIMLAFFFRHKDSWGRFALAGFLYFVISLFPVLGFWNIFFMRYSFVADHYQYIATPGLIALVVSIILPWVSKASFAIRKSGIVLAVLTLGVLASLTWKQQKIYQNSLVLWEDTLRKNPKAWIAHNNLGNEMELLGDMEKAIWYYRQTLRLKPNYAEAEDNLGLALFKMGRVEEAKPHFSKAARLKPDFWQPRNNLGTVLAREGFFVEAAFLFEEVLRIDPGNANAHNNLGLIRERQGLYREALEHWELALIDPTNKRAQVHNNIGAMLLDLGRTEEAISHFGSSLQIEPKLREAQENLALAFKKKR
tara:strand:- start:4767 stop:6542 length:1776 start_codon:yes stop_codon:yes gene_type:complete